MLRKEVNGHIWPVPNKEMKKLVYDTHSRIFEDKKILDENIWRLLDIVEHYMKLLQEVNVDEFTTLKTELVEKEKS